MVEGLFSQEAATMMMAARMKSLIEFFIKKSLYSITCQSYNIISIVPT